MTAQSAQTLPHISNSPATGVYGPTQGAERFLVLDALRGFALFGVLLVNLRDLSLFGFLSERRAPGWSLRGRTIGSIWP